MMGIPAAGSTSALGTGGIGHRTAVRVTGTCHDPLSQKVSVGGKENASLGYNRGESFGGARRACRGACAMMPEPALDRALTAWLYMPAKHEDLVRLQAAPIMGAVGERYPAKTR